MRKHTHTGAKHKHTHTHTHTHTRRERKMWASHHATHKSTTSTPPQRRVIQRAHAPYQPTYLRQQAEGAVFQFFRVSGKLLNCGAARAKERKGEADLCGRSDSH